MIKDSGTLHHDFLQQKKLNVSGNVSDFSGQPLPGVSIIVKGTTQGTVTDFDGNYNITDVSGDAILVFSFVGMQTQELEVEGQTTFNIVMEEDAIGIEEVVAIGYGTQKKGNLTGSVSNVKSDKLEIAPVASTSNTLIGHLPGLVARQTSGMPGSDAAELKIRGFGAALVIVDGIEGDINNLDPAQIESVSILKDGAASIYGSRAGNGVILVTTKRGQNQKPTITINSSYTLQGITRILHPTSSGQLAELQRENHLQSGGDPQTAPWTQEAIDKFYQGGDPAYPNTDWYAYTFRDWAPQQKHNLSIQGGSNKIKYFGYFGYTKQETMVKRNGGDYSRYNAQSNVDADITDNLKMSINLSIAHQKGNFPIRGLNNGGYFWQDYFNTK
ncbi:MAG: SusC/RagA family TonB-linked outer membrane protein, partial [Halanaerobiales bacterium]|nr:SusC/RagA family TonB-linked outer membrane protein [Halanaerobiales bacterium]